MAVFRRDEACFIHPLNCNQMAFGADDRDRNRHMHGSGFFHDRLDELAALHRTQFRHRLPSGR